MCADSSSIAKRVYCKINPFWLSLYLIPDPIQNNLSLFIHLNKPSASPGIFWDTLKAFLCGQFIKTVAAVKTKTRSWEQSVLREVERAESAFIESPSELTERAWPEAQHIAKNMVPTKAENKRFFLQQRFFEEGENTGHMLAMMAKSKKGSSHIETITSPSEDLVSSHAGILSTFRYFYADVYSSKVSPTLAPFLIIARSRSSQPRM